MLYLNNGGTNKGFTLIELMLVMGVIVILVAMLFPVVIGVKNNARKKQALTEAHSIALALKAYRMEFGQWPNQSQAANDKTYFADNYLVVMPLIGHNPRGKVFLSLQMLSSNVSDGQTTLSGQTDFSTNFTDPWGVPYVICLDEDMNGGCLISFTNVIYTNNFVVPPTVYSYSATNYPVTNVEVAVASFAGTTNANQSAFSVETWSEPQ